MNVSCTYVWVLHAFLVLERPEEGVGSFGIGVMFLSHSMGTGNEPGPADALNH